MPTYKALLDDASKTLFESSDTPRIDSEFLLQHVLQQNMAWLIAYGDTIATAGHTEKFHALVLQRHEGLPVAYLTGFRDFWTLTLKVDENVLIPRPDTETLIDEALNRLPDDTPLTVLDLGTGSGAIALSIAKERPLAQITALEYHIGALNIAEQNAGLNKIDNVTFRQSNWFTALNESEKFDLIASNPPYIEPEDPHLAIGDLRFEPMTSLASAENGFADINLIIKGAPAHLKDSGWLIIEHGYNQANQVASMLNENGFMDIELFNDINGLPRCTLGKKTNN